MGQDNETSGADDKTPLTSTAEAPTYRITEAVSTSDPAEHAKRQENAPFRIQGRGSKAKIVSADGRIIMEADPTVGIYGCSVSPNGMHIAVYYGDANYEIVTPGADETITLPQKPPGKNLLGFASWSWLDDQKLLAVSGKVLAFRANQVGPAREEPMISRSVLYIYDLNEKQLSEVALPPELQRKTFSVDAVDEVGKVRIRPEGRKVSYTDATLGWFEIHPTE